MTFGVNGPLIFMTKSPMVTCLARSKLFTSCYVVYNCINIYTTEERYKLDRTFAEGVKTVEKCSQINKF